MTTGTIGFDYRYAAPFLSDHEIEQQAGMVRLAHEMLHQRSGPGSDLLGWVDLPQIYDRSEFHRIQTAARRIRGTADALVVIGVGGSYLGARATIEALGHSFANQLPKAKRQGPEIYFAGKDLSPIYLNQLLEVLEGKEVALNVISKSGTTTEPAIAFRVLRRFMEQRYGKEEARRRIYATTDQRSGALRKLAEEEGYETFLIPDNVGGRYSVLTAVGLLPIAVCGVDIEQLMAGAADASVAYDTADLDLNPSYQYAAARHALCAKGKHVEMLITYEPALSTTAQWWKQLFGESHGKDQKGIFPAAAEFSTDLHSIGQYVQDGLRILFETVLQVVKPRMDLLLESEPGDGDGLNFLSGQSMHEVNCRALQGTLLAHSEGGVPNLLLSLPELNAYHFGQMLYFFQKACGIGGHLLGVNPFDQPGVEAYKQKVFALLGKPGYETAKAALEKQLK